MRKILYPLFLLAIVGTIGVFFWSEISSFWQKSLLIIGAILAFFVFKNILFSLFGFLLNRFSSLLKWIIAGLLFALTTLGIWSYLPEGLQKELISLKPSLSSPLESGKKLISNTSGSLENAARSTSSGIKNGITNGVTEVKDLRGDIKRTLSENNLNLPQAMQIPEDTSNSQDSSTEASSEIKISSWKKPVIQYVTNTPENTDNASTSEIPRSNTGNQENSIQTPEEKIVQEAQKNIEQMRKQNIHLINSGPRAEDHRIIFPTENAQVVYPAEYTISNAIFTGNDIRADQVIFTLTTPEENTAQIEIIISENGKKYNEYKKYFPNESLEENIFFASDINNNQVTYTSFFEGKLWDITITLPTKSTESDFYALLKPARFETK